MVSLPNKELANQRYSSTAMQAASKALKEREAASLTLHAIKADLEKRRHAVAIIEAEGQKV